MPTLRLYVPEISIAQKRHIARELLDTTVREFPLSERRQVNIQFLSVPSKRSSSCRLEVRGRDLDSANRSAFADAAVSLLTRSLHLNIKQRLAWLMGIEPSTRSKVEVRFLESAEDSFSPAENTVGQAIVREWEQHSAEYPYPKAA